MIKKNSSCEEFFLLEDNLTFFEKYLGYKTYLGC